MTGMLCEPRSTSMLKAMEVCDVSLIEEFERRFGESRAWIIDAPARLCLNGEHSDYVPWHPSKIITAASDLFRMRAVVAPRDDGIVRISSTLDKAGDVEFSVDSVRVGGLWIESLQDSLDADWGNYTRGAVARAALDHPDLKYGFDCLFDSTIPSGGGASSSSALVTLSVVAFLLSNGHAFKKADLVQISGEAEWYVGTRGGSMDHATQLLARSDSTLCLNYHPFSSELAPNLPEGYVLVTAFTEVADKSVAVLDAFNELAYVQQQVIPAALPNDWMVMDPESVAAGLPEMTDGMRIRDRFRFVLREHSRSNALLEALSAGDGGRIGQIFDEAFNDTRELLGTHTDVVERVAAELRSMGGVKGVKLMGAGFGGLLLALAEERGGGELDVHHLGKGVHAMRVDDAATSGEVALAAVILCGGAGSRIRAQGVEKHKPLLDVGGVPSTVHVCQSLLRCGLDFSQMLLVVPPEREEEYLESLAGIPVNIVIQDEPLGTGDAVLCVLDHLDDAVQNVYVSFGSQTLVRNFSVRCSLAHHLANDLAFTLPTTIRDNPYAPLQRGMHGEVTGSIETHLEGADMPARGETNIGSYWATREALELVLREFHTKNWVPDAGRYATNSGEFGYPNEMVRGCLAHGLGVDGIPCADPDEVVGIKTQEHLEFIRAELIWRERFED